MKRLVISLMCLSLAWTAGAQDSLGVFPLRSDAAGLHRFSEELVLAAAAGDAESMYLLGKCYESGDGPEQNDYKAVFWYGRAADRGHAAAMNRLGMCYAIGRGVLKNEEEAFGWFLRSARSGNATAMLSVGYHYSLGTDAADQEKARIWFSRALNGFLEMAYSGDVEAMVNVALCYQHGLGDDRNYERSFKWWQEAAALGSPKALTHLGHFYFWGVGTTKNFQEAVSCYRKAALAADADAMYALARCYLYGTGVERSRNQAARWCLRSAENGASDAMYLAGVFYYSGSGLQKDLFRAVQWWQKAAGRGHVDAILRLAGCYSEGTGVEKDLKKGELLLSAAELQRQGKHYRSEQIIAEVMGLFSFFEHQYVDENFGLWLQEHPREGRKAELEKLEELSFEASDRFIARESQQVRFRFSLHRYDAVREVYILRDFRFGEIALPLPPERVEKFERDWKTIQIVNPRYFIRNDRLAVLSMTMICTDGELHVYHFK